MISFQFSGASDEFLVPEKDRLVYCSAVNAGDVPRYLSNGPPAGRNAREPGLPQGAPKVPNEWEPFLLRKPVSGTIYEVLNDDLAMVDVGAQDGVRAGMILGVENNFPRLGVTVLDVQEATCLVKRTGRETYFYYRSRSPLNLGDRVSSRPAPAGP